MKIKSIKRNILNKPKTFYDITVDKYHNFVIGKNSKLVTHNSSLSGAMIGMAQKFKNNLPLLEGDGQFGSLRNPAPAAPRYIGARLHQNFRLIYQDFELLTNKIEEGEKIEPEFFLPIIPMVLVNGTSGIAIGFASNILNRDPFDLILACKNHLNGKETRGIKPFNSEFSGEFVRDQINPSKWHVKGKYEVKSKTIVEITELPVSYTFESYEDILDRLEEKGIILGYDDVSRKKIHYKIKFKPAVLESLLKKRKLEDTLKINSSETENITVIDETGNILEFTKAEDLIKRFIDVRLEWYVIRKEYLIDKLNKEITIASEKARFIKMIIDGKLKIMKRPRTDVDSDLIKFNFVKIDNSYQYLLGMQIGTLTKEKYESLLEDIGIKELELLSVKKTNSKEFYLRDLDELEKGLKQNQKNKYN